MASSSLFELVLCRIQLFMSVLLRRLRAGRFPAAEAKVAKAAAAAAAATAATAAAAKDAVAAAGGAGPRIVSAGEVGAHASRGDCWVVLHGEVYDVTGYVDHHPGKEFLLQAAGQDATAIFDSVHSVRGKALLRSEGFRSRYLVGQAAQKPSEFAPADPAYQEISAEVETYFKNMSGTLWARGGLVEKAVVYTKFAAVMALAVFTKYHSIFRGELGYSVLHGMTLLFVIFNISHGACHGELIMRYPAWFSKASQCAHLLLGSRFGDWMAWHNMSHHQHTNTHQDLDSNRGFPFFRLHRHDPYCWYIRYQHLYVWFLYPLTHIVTFLNREKATAVTSVLTFNLLSWCLVGRCCMLALLIESLVFGFGFVMINHITHTNDETEYLHHPMEKVGWGEHQVRSSSNWAMGNPLFLHLFGGINYQIEHHLFQSVHHVHYPAMSRIVQRVCAKRDIPYVSFPSYLSALRSHHRLLVRMGAPL